MERMGLHRSRRPSTPVRIPSEGRIKGLLWKDVKDRDWGSFAMMAIEGWQAGSFAWIGLGFFADVPQGGFQMFTGWGRLLFGQVAFFVCGGTKWEREGSVFVWTGLWQSCDIEWVGALIHYWFDRMVERETRRVITMDEDFPSRCEWKANCFCVSSVVVHWHWISQHIKWCVALWLKGGFRNKRKRIRIRI